MRNMRKTMGVGVMEVEDDVKMQVKMGVEDESETGKMMEEVLRAKMR